MSFRFRLCSKDGDDLGDYVASRPDWNTGDVLYAEGRPAYRVTAVISTDGLRGDAYAAIFEVEPV
jgi:hypothetical protein